ncbi:Transcriptional repressor EZH1 [Plasmopara halstedii]|uniref:Transcriptional repressor EZH1 n=1 Tax=Plasmopara halstedii TaxID=4781 RepID=A0A0P1AH87_PLAHL|nr:Transcriptional repressor EZH1 [Plasmopara halstedii]CEG40325.1 Transcriptional repressor EZH1 [Plasmopara halstedii]|eukprot:XP_024576694.1 Transcriptional repressor EZH1 [Plasmopara halstedii]
MEVIVVDDSSDASSEGEMTQSSASSTSLSPLAPQWERAQSVGYADAVEAALAMAAALDTTEMTTNRSSITKKKRATLAPPLLATKSKKTLNQQHIENIPTREREKSCSQKSTPRRRRGMSQRTSESSLSRTNLDKFSSDSDSDLSSSMNVGSRRHHRFSVAKAKRHRSSNRTSLDKVELKGRVVNATSLIDRSRSDGSKSLDQNKQQPAEVVDLWSSSSSSSEYIRDRQLVSSPTSSDTDSSKRTQVNTAKQQLAVNGRAKRKITPVSHDSSKEKCHRLNLFEHTKKQVTSEKLARVQHKPASGDIQLRFGKVFVDNSGASRNQKNKTRLVDKKSDMSIARSQSKARKKATDVSVQSCHPQSVSVDIHSSVTPSAVPAMSSNVSSPSPRKKRRVAPRFNPDRVALTDLQAQEHELARICSQLKQTQNKSRAQSFAAQEAQTSQDVISMNGLSGANSAVSAKESTESENQERQQTRKKVGNLVTTTSQQSREKEENLITAASQQTRKKVENEVTATSISVSDACKAIMHPTSYRGVYFAKAPPNILVLCDPAFSAPFESDCNRPLTFYDETNSLSAQCSILTSFGKSVQCISSVFPGDAAKPQGETTRSVNALVTARLPLIRHCYRSKLKATLTEARAKVIAYQAALRKYNKAQRGRNVSLSPYLLPLSLAEKAAMRKLKAVQFASCQSFGEISVFTGQGNDVVRENAESPVVQINRLNEIQPLRKYTTSIGLCVNYRVDDNPIQRYVVSSSEDTVGNENGRLMKKYRPRYDNIADEEVAEYVLRLVVNCLGASDQIFYALKSELGFAQAYTAYSELKKLHDSRQHAKLKLDRVEKLLCNEKHAQNTNVRAMTKLMEKLSFSRSMCSLNWRLHSPICNFESNIADNLVDGATFNVAGLGLRIADSYKGLVDVFHDSFCRVCYMYACHEHGNDHPLPARRVDPIYPRVNSTTQFVAPSDCKDGVVPGKNVIWLDGEEDEEMPECESVVYDLSEEVDASNKRNGEVINLDSDDDMNSRCRSKQSQRHKRTLMVDPSEYVDATHVPLVAAKMHLFLSATKKCSSMCCKKEKPSGKSVQEYVMSAAELSLIRKLRETMGDNSCLLSAILDSASCNDIHELIENEQTSDKALSVTDRVSRSGRGRSWTQRQRIGESNHELLQRTRNQRLQDRGTESHEYQPCAHTGMCNTSGCSCMKRDHMCEKACACSRDCPNRFEGCSCSPGECRTSKCPCFAAQRECDPDVCIECGASDVAVSKLLDQVRYENSLCGNVNVMHGQHKRLSLGISTIHGYGIFAREAIASAEFVYEYTGAMLSQDEAERRGMIYDKMEMSYLFDLNEDAVLDALRCGNKSKFINHSSDKPNCTAKVVSVCGVHHITIWALRDIKVGEELLFDYGYKRSVGPDWSQRRAESNDSN